YVQRSEFGIPAWVPAFAGTTGSGEINDCVRVSWVNQFALPKSYTSSS
nr:hypothetical protein [Tanacetum cinerariifolium]